MQCDRTNLNDLIQFQWKPANVPDQPIFQQRPEKILIFFIICCCPHSKTLLMYVYITYLEKGHHTHRKKTKTAETFWLFIRSKARRKNRKRKEWKNEWETMAFQFVCIWTVFILFVCLKRKRYIAHSTEFDVHAWICVWGWNETQRTVCRTLNA